MFVTDHFEIDTIACTVIIVGVVVCIIENMNNFPNIYPIIRDFVILNSKCGIGIEAIITIIWITQFKTTAVSGNASRSKF